MVVTQILLMFFAFVFAFLTGYDRPNKEKWISMHMIVLLLLAVLCLITSQNPKFVLLYAGIAALMGEVFIIRETHLFQAQVNKKK